MYTFFDKVQAETTENIQQKFCSFERKGKQCFDLCGGHLPVLRLTSGHSECPTKFYHLETSTWKLRHHPMYRRIMYHHHLVTRDKTETICKMYQQQKKDSIKDDWNDLLKADFRSIKQELNEEEISSLSKIECKKIIRQWMNNSVFEYF